MGVRIKFRVFWKAEIEFYRFITSFCENNDILEPYHIDFDHNSENHDNPKNPSKKVEWSEIGMVEHQKFIFFTKTHAKSTDLHLSFSKHSKFYSNSKNSSRTVNLKKGFFFFEKWANIGYILVRTSRMDTFNKFPPCCQMFPTRGGT